MEGVFLDDATSFAALSVRAGNEARPSDAKLPQLAE